MTHHHAVLDFFGRCLAALCQPSIAALQFHGIVPAILLGTLWLLAGLVRYRALVRLRLRPREGKTAGTRGTRVLNAAHDSPPSQLPRVTVVLPVRGCRTHSVANWESILSLQYGACCTGC